MSEPESGSDLASLRTRATRCAGGWRVTGTKLWVTGAHRAHALMVLARTSPADTANRHAGLSQFIVATTSSRVAIRPIRALDGGHPFNEVVCDDVFVPDDMVLGEIGEGWRQVTSDLAFERSGPERFLSTYPLVEHLVRVVRRDASDRHHAAVGALLARLWTLRQMSLAVAGSLAGGVAAEIPAALVKDLGTRFESEVVEVARTVLDIEPDASSDDAGAAIAHQIHGALGITHEHSLRLSTTRLWAWREEWGSDVQAARQVAAAALAAGEQDLWPLLVGT